MNHLQLFWFYLFSLTAIAASLVVVTNRHPTYAVLALTVTMLALSALFVLLKAYFVAIIQILIYAGAILVLFLFVVMLLGVEGPTEPVGNGKTSLLSRSRPVIQCALTFFFMAEIGFVIVQAKHLPAETSNHLSGTAESIGEALFSRYLLPFELVSGILLIGIFGVVSLAYQGRKK